MDANKSKNWTRGTQMKLLAFICIIASLLVPMSVSAHEAPIRVVVLGEDSDRNAVSRSSKIYRRVVAEFQQSLLRENITVICEALKCPALTQKRMAYIFRALKVKYKN